MENLKKYSDIFADLAQSSYTQRPKNFAEPKKWDPDQLEAQHYGASIPFDFQKDQVEII